VISERTRQTRDLIRPVIEAAAEPLATTEISELIGVWQVNVYTALRSLERSGQVERAGRVGSAARAEVLWRRTTDPVGTPTPGAS
jgi:Mn-dependent DtxR family transcriptional regulator